MISPIVEFRQLVHVAIVAALVFAGMGLAQPDVANVWPFYVLTALIAAAVAIPPRIRIARQRIAPETGRRDWRKSRPRQRSTR